MILLGFVGPWQVVIIIFAIVLLFGGRKIPELMKGIGEGLSEFKKVRDQQTKEGAEKDKKETKTE
jgi:sec-independent protein translocase protein TatA